jgi:hypothetical protein
MADETPQSRQQKAARSDDARQDRLKLKLRENLKRRKTQIKERSAMSSDGHQASPNGELGKRGR